MNKVLLVILDGFGISEKREHNAVLLAKTPFLDGVLQQYPHSQIQTSGESVGLPEGIMGNSEVGHTTIGSGRVVLQDVIKISRYAQEKGFDSLPEIQKALKQEGAMHFVGLLSDGCVHSDQEHLFSLIRMAVKYPAKKFFIHVITDGRDTAPQSGLGFVLKLEQEIKGHPHIQIATVSGRFYAMDRDKRWERIQRAYNVMALSPEKNPDGAKVYQLASEAVQDNYALGVTDEFIVPSYVQSGRAISADDQVVFFNYRADRARELSMAFALPGFSEVQTPVKVKVHNWLCFAEYKDSFPFPVLFKKELPVNTLGEIVAGAGYSQLRISETEKYAHVTFYFSGGREDEFAGEKRILIPSPKSVATYDLKPEMSAREITTELVHAIKTEDYALIIVNYANGDMVGHTGVESAAIQAVEVLDECLKQVVTAGLERGYTVLVSADHGNCEQMLEEETQQPFTQHTTNVVPLIWISEQAKGHKLNNGSLADLAPTVLDIMGLSIPDEMTGKSLIVK